MDLTSSFITVTNALKIIKVVQLTVSHIESILNITDGSEFMIFFENIHHFQDAVWLFNFLMSTVVAYFYSQPRRGKPRKKAKRKRRKK